MSEMILFIIVMSIIVVLVIVAVSAEYRGHVNEEFVTRYFPIKNRITIFGYDNEEVTSYIGYIISDRDRRLVIEDEDHKEHIIMYSKGMMITIDEI